MHSQKLQLVIYIIGIPLLFVGVLGISLLTSQHVDANSDSGGSSSSGGSNSSSKTSRGGGVSQGDASGSDRYDRDVNNALSNRESVVTETTSAGNQITTVGSRHECGSGCRQVTKHYRNDDGTYNTVTSYESRDDDDDSRSYSSAGACPRGYTKYQGACYPDSSCHTQGGGKGGGKTVCTGNPGSGSGSSSGPDNCSLDGVTVSHGDTYTFYEEESVPYGSSCSGQGRRCNDGNLSGSGNYNQSSCFVEDAPPISDVTITADPRFVRPSESTTISWDGGNAEECTVEGPMISATGVTGSREVSGLNGEAEYTLHCTLDTQEADDTATVQIIPEVQET